MAFTKKFLKSRAACKVRFTVAKEESHGAEALFLVGSFDNWDTNAHPMKRGRDGSFSIEVELPSGKDYAFRYLTSTGFWFNDHSADAYVCCYYAGADNFLVKV